MKYVINIILIIFTLPAYAQQKPTVLATNSADGKGADVRYYAEGLFFEDGVHIYRRESGSSLWEKLTSEPLKRGKPIAAEAFEADEELRSYVAAIAQAKPDDLTGLLAVSLAIKAIRHEDFARFVGIHFDDEQATPGKTYEYDVRKIERRRETSIGTSQPVFIKTFEPEPAPREFTAEKVGHDINLKWTPEPERFYATNIYRRMNDSSEVLMNPQPLIVAKIPDAAGVTKLPEFFFVNRDVKPGTYHYSIAGIDLFGRETQRTESVTIEIEDRTPPPPAEKATVEIDHTNLTVTIQWQPVVSRDLVGYHAYRSRRSDGVYEKQNTRLILPGISSFTQTVSKAGKYYFYIASVDAAGNESPSNLIYAEVKDVIAPAPPQHVLVRTDTGTIVIDWARNTEPDVRGYHVYQRTANERFSLINASASIENHFAWRVPRNIKNDFEFVVVAVDSAFNRSAPSMTVGAALPDVTPPPAPFIRDISSTENSIALAWLPSSAKDAAAFTVHRTTGDKTEKIATLPIDRTAFTDTAVAPDEAYTYHLTVSDSSGNVSLPSFKVTGSLRHNRTANTNNTLRGVYDSLSSEIALSWSASGADVSGFVIYRKQPDEEFKPISGLTSNPSFRDLDVQRGNRYIYWVKGFSPRGASIITNEIIVETK